MSKFISMAEEAKATLKGTDINSHIEKIATDKELNINEKQRLAEEVNVSTFLDKLKSGTQHEDFPIVGPSVTHDISEPSETLSPQLGKAASVDYSDKIQSSMFYIGCSDSSEVMNDLPKTASVTTGDEIFTSEDKWRDQEDKRTELKEMNEVGFEKLAFETESFNTLGKLTREVSYSEGMTKTAAVILSNNDLDELASSMLENSKFSHMDVVSSNAEELSKEASELMTSLLEKISKKKISSGLLKDTGKTIVDVSKGLASLAKFPFKQPIATAAVTGAALYANSDNMNDSDRQRLQMMSNNYNH